MVIDDALLHLHSIKLISAVVTTKKAAIDNVAQSAVSWHGPFGHSKTEKVVISQTAKEETQQLGHGLTMEGQPTKIVTSHQHIGVSFTDSLQ